ncbi:hypothetical protein HY251_09445 [bacterium]|nr:hypothetical protein [bacterium]
MSDEQGETPRRSSSLPWIIVGCLFVVVLACLGSSLMFGMGWSKLVGAGVSSDLNEYHEKVRASDLDADVKQRILLRLEALREKASDGKIAFVRWVDHSEMLESYLKTGTLAAADSDAFERELSSVEREAGIAPVTTGG